MDEKTLDRIDQYIRHEMTSEECLRFEQDALNDAELRKELELTYLIKRSLAKRQQKIFKTAQWERRRHFQTAIVATIGCLAAMFILGFLLLRPSDISMPEKELIANNVSPATIHAQNKEIIRSVRISMKNGNAEEAIATIDNWEQTKKILPSDNATGSKLMANETLSKEDADTLNSDAYELHWLKICSLVKVGKKKEAIASLKTFINIEGQYKAKADSLLKTFR